MSLLMLERPHVLFQAVETKKHKLKFEFQNIEAGNAAGLA